MFELYCQSITYLLDYFTTDSFIARVKYQMHCAGDIVSLFYSTARAPAKRFSTHSIYFEFFNLKSIEFLFLKFTYSTIIDSMKSVRSLKYSNLKLSVRTATAHIRIFNVNRYFVLVFHLSSFSTTIRSYSVIQQKTKKESRQRSRLQYYIP